MVGYPINAAGVAIVKDYESVPRPLRKSIRTSPGGAALQAYRCPAGVWTTGWGHTSGVREGSELRTEGQAEALLAGDLMTAKNIVVPACMMRPNPNQLAALVVLCFNIGADNFLTSTVLRAHNRGDFQAAGRAFNLFVKARVNGRLVELPGLVSRRARESALYLKAAGPDKRTMMPQAVAAEPSLATSGSAAGAGVAAGAGALATSAEALRQFGDVAWSLSPIMDLLRYAPLAFAGVAAVGIGWWLWHRYRQRQQGWH